MIKLVFEFHDVPGGNLAMTYKESGENPSDTEAFYSKYVINAVLLAANAEPRKIKGMFRADCEGAEKLVDDTLADLKNKRLT